MPDAWKTFYDPEYPMEWHYPPELAEPARSPLDNLVILILSSNIVGNDVTEMLGLYMAAESRFNVWYGEGTGGDRTPRELAELRTSNMDSLRRVYCAWKVLEERFAAGDRHDFETAHNDLLNTLKDAVSETAIRMGQS